MSTKANPIKSLEEEKIAELLLKLPIRDVKWLVNLLDAKPIKEMPDHGEFSISTE